MRTYFWPRGDFGRLRTDEYIRVSCQRAEGEKYDHAAPLRRMLINFFLRSCLLLSFAGQVKNTLGLSLNDSVCENTANTLSPERLHTTLVDKKFLARLRCVHFCSAALVKEAQRRSANKFTHSLLASLCAASSAIGTSN